MTKLTAQMIHEAYCIATPDAWNSEWSEISQAALARYTVMADYLNGRIAPQETSVGDERGWYPCATPDCGAQVRADGSLCEACQACEELGFATYSDHNALINDGFHGVDEPCDHAQPPEERSPHDTGYSDDPTYGQLNL